MDRYTKIKQIGEGSFGKALLVRNKENGKQFVVKEINMSRMAKKERDEARKEVAVLAQLNHPNIVTYRESFEEIGNLYIVMDYCDAGDLYSRINSQRGILFTEDQIIDWFVQSCLAIKHIHDRKILHRDIKSQNIFMTRHGIVKLGDFGIAKVLNSTVELARTCIGTPYYLSPEICENKPYNNKSDIWSLGCVLYELTTLKHAFEAGNMKNLVLKIIRGNFPPPPPRYSYDLRSLINQLFKRSPRDRPSINSVLKKPILQARIRKFLSESEVADEFSHTVMHGVKMKKALPAGGGRPLPPKPAPVAARRPPSAPTPRYNPASVYGVPVNRRSKDVAPVKKSSDAVRKSGGAKKPSSSGGGGAGAYNAELARKKQELIEKERKRREEAKKKENAYAKQHQDLIEKQKKVRMNKAREEGWRNLIDSLSSEDSNRVPSRAGHGAKLQPRKLRSVYKSPYAQKVMKSPRSDEVKKPTPAPAYKPSTPARVPNKERPSYDHYHDYLDKLDRERKAAMAAPQARPVSARDAPVNGAQAPPAAVFDPAYNAMKGQAAGAHGHAAAERARLVEEYMQRKAMAANNRARAHGDLYGGAKGAINPPVRAPAPKISVGAPKPSAGQHRPQSARNSDSAKSSAAVGGRARPMSAKEKQEQEYLARLKQIRLQNFNERRGVHDRGNNKGDDRYKPPKDPNDPELRKKKIEALRAQADERAKRLKEELEKKRRAAYEQERRNLQGVPVVKPANRPVIAAKPSPAVPITQVLNAIGAAPQAPAPSKEPSIGMTAAMSAIGASRSEENRVSIQKTKEQILKRLNAKSIDPENSKDNSEEPNNKQDRPKWGQPIKPVMVPDRPKWGDETSLDNLGKMELEQTASQMDATSARDVVLTHPGDKSKDILKEEDNEEAQPSARKNWGAKPSSTVLNLLKAAELKGTSAGAMSVSSDSSESSVAISQPTKAGSTITISKAPAAPVGSTITISGRPNKGTVVLKKASEPGDQSDLPDSAPVQDSKNTLLESDKELIIEEKEQDETEASKDDDEKKQTEQKDNTTLDVPSKTSPRPKSKSRSPSPKPKSPRSDTTKPKKLYKPEIEVEIKDLPDDKSPLFSKVDLEEEDKDSGKNSPEAIVIEDLDEEFNEIVQDEDKETESAVKPKSKSGLLMSLCTGNFDIGDVKLLRTCSEPNLAKLFETDLVENPFYTEEEVAKSVQLAASLLEEHVLEEEEDEVDDAALVRASLQKVMDADEDDENEEDLEYSIKDIPTLLGDEEDDDEDDIKVEGLKEDDDKDAEDVPDGSEDEDDENDDDDDDDDGEDDDADMETLRQSMMDILDNEGTISDDESMSASKKKAKKVSKKGKKARKKRRERLDAEAAAASAARGDGDKKTLYAKQWSASSVEDFKSMRETMKSLLQPDAGTKPKLSPVKEAGPAGDNAAVKVDDTIMSLNPNTEAWQSDDGSEPDDDYWEEEDMFSRLEETRMKLEEELGCETFMKAYKTVQAIHADEDENMEEGLKLVTSILGETKSHLYSNILQLVMADGVWTEDND